MNKLFKLLLALPMVVLCYTFTACSDDDNDLIGTWEKNDDSDFT